MQNIFKNKSNNKDFSQNLIDVGGLDESFYLALLDHIMQHRKIKEKPSKRQV